MHASPTLTPTAPLLSPAIIAAAIFAAAYTLAAAIGALATGNGEFIFYIVVMVILSAGVALIHWKLRLSAGLIWGLAIWGGLHMAGGLVPVPESWPINGETRVLYSWWIIPGDINHDGAPEGYLKFDHLVHAFGYGVTAFLCWEGLRAIALKQGAVIRPTIGILALIVCASTGLGAMNEIVEFTATLLGPTNVGGYLNTSLDLIANTTGAIIAGVIIGITYRTHAHPPLAPPLSSGGGEQGPKDRSAPH